MSILFCELVGLQAETVKETMEMVSTMNEVFSAFDQLMDKFNVYKVPNARTLEKATFKKWIHRWKQLTRFIW